MIVFPEDKMPRGTYVLILTVGTRCLLKIGRLGRFKFQPGYYAYVGSALGAGGIPARLKHHLSPCDRCHWHIDYLRQAARPEAVWYVSSETRWEHHWADALSCVPGASIPAAKFGASDCRCAAHLFHFLHRPQRRIFRDILIRRYGNLCDVSVQYLRALKL